MQQINSCRACQGKELTALFSLGTQIVSDFTSKENIHKAPECPIRLVLCPNCKLIQQEYTAPQDFMYTRHYWYRCISAQQKLFARVKGWGRYKDTECLVHDTADKILSSPYEVSILCVSKDGGTEWRKILHREANTQEVYEIEFFTGDIVTVSGNHKWARVRSDMTWTKEKLTTELNEKDRVPIVMHVTRPEEVIEKDSFYNESIGYLIGVYIAEGSIHDKSIRLATHLFNDKRMLSKVNATVKRFGESCIEYIKENQESIETVISGSVILSIINSFVVGDSSKNKRLTYKVWTKPLDFLKGILAGWLDGDGHYEENEKRWRFNICVNKGLVDDMNLICKLLNYVMRFRKRKATGFRGEGEFNQYCGWIRQYREGMRQKNTLGGLMATSVSSITKKQESQKTWDISVGGDQLYALGCGIVTHNSGTTLTMRDSLHDLVDAIQSRVKIEKGDIVLDIGSNDSTLLRYYRKGPITVGVEPASNLQEEAKIGIDYLINDFWSYSAYERFLLKENFAAECLSSKVKPKVITACGMFYDLPEPQKFISDISRVLHPNGVFIAQLMCAKQMYDKKDVGNLAHEHIEFYTLSSLLRMFDSATSPLEIFDIQENDVNGGSYRLWIKHKGNESYPTAQKTLDKYLWAESMLHDSNAHYVWSQWYNLVNNNRDEAMKWITEQTIKGRKGMVLGASTKGNVLLQWYGIDNRMIQYASERSPEKVGKFTVGTGIECISEKEARDMSPDYYIVLPYTFKNEIIEREKAHLSRGGQLVFLLPEFEVVGY